jgi:ATP-dependent Clp protease ATP-binding subunit ClpB
MQLDRFTTKAQGALQEAQRLAQERSHQAIDGEHLMLALLQQDEGLTQPLLQKLGVPTARLLQELEAELSRRAKVQGGTEPYLTPELRKALDAAENPISRRNFAKRWTPLKRRRASSKTITPAPSTYCSA